MLSTYFRSRVNTRAYKGPWAPLSRARGESGAADGRRVLLGVLGIKVVSRLPAVVLVIPVLLVIAAAVRAMFGPARVVSAVAAEMAVGARGSELDVFWEGLRRFRAGRCFKVSRFATVVMVVKMAFRGRWRKWRWGRVRCFMWCRACLCAGGGSGGFRGLRSGGAGWSPSAVTGQNGSTG